MSTSKKTKILALMVSSVFFVLLVLASTGIANGEQGPTGWQQENAGSPTIANPLGSGQANASVEGLLAKIMKLVTTVGTVVVVFFIIFSGFKFVTAGSSDTDRTDARKMFYATIIGGAILLGANLIASVVVQTVNNTLKK